MMTLPYTEMVICCSEGLNGICTTVNEDMQVKVTVTVCPFSDVMWVVVGEGEISSVICMQVSQLCMSCISL